MSEEFDREKQNNFDVSSSQNANDGESRYAYEDGMKVAHIYS